MNLYVTALNEALRVLVSVAPFLAGRRAVLAIVSLSLLPDAFSGLVAARIKAQQRMEVSAAITLGTRLVYSLVGGGLLRFTLAGMARAKTMQQGCIPLEGFCTSGSVEWCEALVPPELRFDQCAAEGFVLDGTIQLSPGVGVYTMSFVDFSVDGLSMTGPVAINLAS